MIPIFSRVQKIIDEGQVAALATVVESHGSTPRKPSARMIIFRDGTIEGTVGGGALEKKVIDEAAEVIKTGQPKLVEIELQDNTPHSVGGICGGGVKIFLEKIGNIPRLFIFGAGHVGQTLARMAVEFDWEVVVYDDREEFTNPANFPEYVKTVHAPFEEALERLQPTEQDYIVIVTYKHANDSTVLKQALQYPARYIGMIGSELKCVRIKDKLLDEGVSEEHLQRVVAPIGLDIGAHAPNEVAVSILAQLIRVMNGLPAHETHNVEDA